VLLRLDRERSLRATSFQRRKKQVYSSIFGLFDVHTEAEAAEYALEIITQELQSEKARFQEGDEVSKKRFTFLNI
jgi:hypothetical protein